jgi:hypothetical protein
VRTWIIQDRDFAPPNNEEIDSRPLSITMSPKRLATHIVIMTERTSKHAMIKYNEIGKRIADIVIKVLNHDDTEVSPQIVSSIVNHRDTTLEKQVLHHVIHLCAGAIM